MKEKKMTNKKIWLGVLLSATLALSFVSCAILWPEAYQNSTERTNVSSGDTAIIEDSRLVGTWRASARVGEYPGDVVQFTFNDGQFEILREWGADRMNRSLIDPWLKGTYTTDNKGVIATKTTHVYDTSGKKWTSKDEAIANLKSQNRTDAQINDIIARNFIDWSSRYSISGNVLTINDVAIDDDDYAERGTFTKQN